MSKSVMMCWAADGTFLPPYILYNLQVKFLRRLESGNFRFPDIDDTSFIDISEVIEVLRPIYANRGIYSLGKILVG